MGVCRGRRDSNILAEDQVRIVRERNNQATDKHGLGRFEHFRTELSMSSVTASVSVWKAASIFARYDERFDHFRLLEVAGKLV
jgi:hypothetical protein